MKKSGRPTTPCDATASEMQARALEVMRKSGLKNKDVARLIGRSKGAVGHVLSAQPARQYPTLIDINNHFFPSSVQESLSAHAQELVVRAPETAALLSAVFRDLADLLAKPTHS